MAKSVLPGLFLLYGMIANSVSDAVACLIGQISTRNLPMLANVTLALELVREVTAPMPNAAYIVSGELTLERKKDRKKQRFSGQAVSEAVGTSHRGVAGNEPVVLIDFYARSPGVPLTQ